MNLTSIFISYLALTVAVCIGMVVYVSRHLRLLLIELCGNADRATFWLAFSNVCLVLVPVIFALDYSPVEGTHRLVVLEIAAQLKYALIGFLASFAVLGVILLRFIPRGKASTPSN